MCFFFFVWIILNGFSYCRSMVIRSCHFQILLTALVRNKNRNLLKTDLLLLFQYVLFSPREKKSPPFSCLITFIEIFKENENHLVKACLRWMGLENLKAFLNNIIYFNLTLQYNKWMKSFLSLLPERREMRASKKCRPGSGCRIEPRSSRTKGVCATEAPLHIHIQVTFKNLLRFDTIKWMIT